MNCNIDDLFSVTNLKKRPVLKISFTTFPLGCLWLHIINSINADTEPIHKNALRNPFCRGRIPIYDNRKLPYFFFLFAETTAAPTTPTAAKLKTIPVSGLSSGSFSFVVSAISPSLSGFRAYHRRALLHNRHFR